MKAAVVTRSAASYLYTQPNANGQTFRDVSCNPGDIVFIRDDEGDSSIPFVEVRDGVYALLFSYEFEMLGDL